MTSTGTKIDPKQMDKDDLLRSVFYDVRRGFGSQAATLKAAREQNPSVTLADVKDFLGRQELRQAKRSPARYNTWVPKAPREEFQIDLMDFGMKTVPRYAFVAVDIFTKKLAAVPHGRQNQQTDHSGIACCHQACPLTSWLISVVSFRSLLRNNCTLSTSD